MNVDENVVNARRKNEEDWRESRVYVLGSRGPNTCGTHASRYEQRHTTNVRVYDTVVLVKKQAGHSEGALEEECVRPIADRLP